MPLLGDPAHGELIAALRQLPALVPRPRAIVVVTAHWEVSATPPAPGPLPGCC